MFSSFFLLRYNTIFAYMIEEKDLYRIFTIKKGDYKGDYKLYFNRKVAEYYLPENTNIYKWDTSDIFKAEPGDYIESLDGSVVMLLRIRNYKSNGLDHWFFRFPMCTIRVYQKKDGEYKYGEFYGQMTYLNKNRIVSATVVGTQNQRVRFATMLVTGVHPFKAYRIAFSKFEPIQIDVLHKRITKLMTDKVVKSELKSQIVPLAEKLGEDFTDERLIKELNLLLDTSRKGSMNHRENLKFIMGLLNKLPATMYPGNRKDKQIPEEADFEEVPPELGQAD